MKTWKYLDNIVPIFSDNEMGIDLYEDGWYFWDEVQHQAFGPHVKYEECLENRKDYSDSLSYSEEDEYHGYDVS